MSVTSILLQFSKLSIWTPVHQNVRNICITPGLSFRLTQKLYGEPLKKKKKMDPAIIKAREERRKKKIEKQIRRLEKNARQLKPIEEMEVPLTLLDHKSARLRPVVALSEEEVERRALLEKTWTRFKYLSNLKDNQEIDRIIGAQQKALNELRIVSEDLYDEAVTIDLNLVPFKAEGPVATPAINDYVSPDGEYIDISKKWDN